MQQWIDTQDPAVQVRSEEIPGGTIYFLDQPAAAPALQPVQVIYEESADVAADIWEQSEAFGPETVFYPGGAKAVRGQFRRDWKPSR